MGFFSQFLAGLRIRLLLLVVVACAPLVVLTLHSASEDRRRQVANWRQRTQHMVEIAKKEEEEMLGQSRQLLLALAVAAPVRSGRADACKNLLDKEFGSYSHFSNLGVISTNGVILASARSWESPVRPMDAEFFRRTIEAKEFSVGNLNVGSPVAKPTVGFGYPVLDRDNVPRAVVFATLDLSWFNRFGSAVTGQLPLGGTWTEIDNHGTILVRYPSPAEWIGRPFAEKQLLDSVLRNRDSVLISSATDGVPSVYAFAAMESRLVNGSVTAIMGIPKQVLFAVADQTLRTHLTWIGLAFGLALALGWVGSDLLVLRRVKALVESSARLASGDFTARTGLPHGRDELGRLTLTFDLMAQALEQRELERNRASKKVQVLSHRLVEVQENERRHIARELHDEIGQSLTVAEMNLQAMLRTQGNGARQRRLQESIQAVERVAQQVHDLSLNLRPSMLDDLGLEPALRWCTQRQAALTGMQTKFQADLLERRLDPVIETECFRVAQEALTNVVRHARAKALTVELHQEDSQLHLLVRDDGVGFDVAAQREEAVHGASLGLLSMEERATLAGGGLLYRSAPGQGTEVHAWFPLRWQKEKATNHEPATE